MTSMCKMKDFFSHNREKTADPQKKKKKPNINMEELSDALEVNDSELNEEEKILKGVVNFGSTIVEEIMCPRIDITAIEYNSKFKDIIPVIIDSGFSRIPVYDETFDNVKGILYAKSILPYMNGNDDFKWQTLLMPPCFIPENKKIKDLLKEFQSKKIHMAIVIDEYGGTSGLVTLEDILEEIVGEITDESDEDEILYKKLNDTKYIFLGKVLLDDFIEILNLDNDSFANVRGESETLAGLILELTGEFPEKGQVILYDRFKFTIESLTKRRITKIKVDIINKSNSAKKEDQ